MPIKFLNIRSREVRVAETEPQITAMWASSDRSPNITQGQDFGWRLAPEVVVEMKQIKGDFQKLQEIAVRYAMPLDAVGEPEILQYISEKTNPNAVPVADEGDYTDEYNDEIRRLEHGDAVVDEASNLTDAELEAILAKRKASAADAATTDTVTTTTSTTKIPTATTDKSKVK